MGSNLISHSFIPQQKQWVPWLDEDVLDLLKCVQRKDSIEQISAKFNRPYSAVLGKLKSLAADYFFNDKRPFEEIIKFTGLGRDEINDAIAKRRWRLSQGNSYIVRFHECSPTQKNSTLIDQADKLKLLELINIWKEVANVLKKGHQESVYRDAICIDLQGLSIHYDREETMPIIYKGRTVGQIRADIVLYNWLPIVIELKATSSEIKQKHTWQCVRYMKAKNFKYGAVVNFTDSETDELSYIFIVSINDVFTVYCPETDDTVVLKDY
jgi:GxxExxY protein